MNIIGLSGAIGSGKTTFCEQALALQIPVIDLDIIGRELLEKKDIQQSLCDLFNLHKNLSVKSLKKNLREVLTCPSKRKELEHYLHPMIFQELLTQLEQLKQRCSCLILTIPVSSVLRKIPVEYQYKITIEAHKTVRESRLIKRYGLNQDRLIINLLKLHQEELSERIAWADKVLFNNLTLNSWKEQCQVVINSITKTFK